MPQQKLDKLDPQVTVNVKKNGMESTEDGTPLDQLQALVCGAGPHAANGDIRLLVWSEDENKWYIWNKED